MAKLKPGTRVRLKGRIPLGKTSQLIQVGQKGRVIAVSDKTYTVLFDDSPTPIYGLTKKEIEAIDK
jgi:hypothetical protein